jgi:hypothetical protein
MREVWGNVGEEERSKGGDMEVSTKIIQWLVHDSTNLNPEERPGRKALLIQAGIESLTISSKLS